MSLNFDAKITLDVTQFLASAKKAETAIERLDKKIKAVNGLNINPGKGKGASSTQATQATFNLSIAPALGQLTRLENKVKNTVQFINSQKPTLNVNTTQTQNTPGSNDPADKQKVIRDSEDLTRTLARERYALYDVAAAYQQMQAIATGALRAVIGTAAQYEREFANVARTTEFTSAKAGEAARVMKESLKDLAAQIPVSFKGITEIATIGNQLGIAQGSIVSFTKSIAEFSSVTGVTVENAAMSFGRIGELLNEQDYNKVGSAIAYAGVKAVATEAQILSVTKEIATTAKMAKFSTADVIGLATALSSLGIAPEAARGSIIRTFAGINQAISQGGKALEGYAEIAGMTASDFASSWQSNGEVAFGSFLKGLQETSDSGKNLDTVLRSLGLHNVRDIQTVQKLGDNYDVYAESIANANKGFTEGTFLSAAYAVVQDTVVAKLQKVQNQWDNLMATFGDINTDSIKGLLDIISEVIKTLDEFAKNPAGKTIIAFATAATGLVVAIAAVNSILAISKATVFAFQSAVTSLTATEAANIATTNGMAVSFSKMKVAWLALQNTFKAAAITGAIIVAVEAVNGLADAFERAYNNADYTIRKAESSLGSFAGLQDAISLDYVDAFQKYGSDAGVAAAIAAGQIDGLSAAVDDSSSGMKEATQAAEGLATITGTDLSASVDTLSGKISSQSIILGENYRKWLKNTIAQSESFKKIALDNKFTSAITEIGYSFDAAEKAARGGKFKEYFTELGNSALASGKITQDSALQLSIFIKELELGVGPLADLENAFKGSAAQGRLLGINTDLAADAINKLAKAPEKFITETRDVAKSFTIWDYVAEIQSKMKTAFDWKFEAIIAADKVTSAWLSVRKAFDDARKSIADIRIEMNKISANKQILEYQLSVAIRYGDTLRAAKLEAEIADLNAKLAENANKAAEAQSGASTSLKGNTEEAIRNRQTLRELTTDTINWLTTQKYSGKTTNQMIKSAKDQKIAFIEQAKGLGFSAGALDEYTKMFDSYIEILKKSPDKLDLSMKVYANMDPADAAMRKWKEANKSTTIDVLVKNPEYESYLQNKKYQDLSAANKSFVDNAIFSYKKLMSEADSMKLRGNLSGYKKAISRLNDLLSNADALKGGLGDMIVSRSGFSDSRKIKLASGGAVRGPGSGTSDSIPAMLSNGEYVLRADAVRSIGVDNLDRMNNLQKFATGGMVGKLKSSSLNNTYAESQVLASMGSYERVLREFFKVAGQKFSINGKNPLKNIKFDELATEGQNASAFFKEGEGFTFGKNSYDSVSNGMLDDNSGDWLSVDELVSHEISHWAGRSLGKFGNYYKKPSWWPKGKTTSDISKQINAAKKQLRGIKSADRAERFNSATVVPLERLLKKMIAEESSRKSKEEALSSTPYATDVATWEEFRADALAGAWQRLAGKKRKVNQENFFSTNGSIWSLGNSSADGNHANSKTQDMLMDMGYAHPIELLKLLNIKIPKQFLGKDWSKEFEGSGIPKFNLGNSSGYDDLGTWRLFKPFKAGNGMLQPGPDIFNTSDLDAGKLSQWEGSGWKFPKDKGGLPASYKDTFATGGFVSGPGTGTSDSIMARLSNGEFVVNAAATRAYGTDFLNALNQQQAPRSLGGSTGSAGSVGGSQVVYLSPDDRNLLRAAIDRPVNLYTENTKIAQSANAGNVVLAQRGSN